MSSVLMSRKRGGILFAEADNLLHVVDVDNQKMNDYIKDLAEICGFADPVTYIYYQGGIRHEEVYPKWSVLGTHGARRTFVCNALAFGVPAEIIMKITGHSNYAAMKPYVAISDASKKKAMDMFNKR